MLKLLIADDERVIRETISTLIDWKQYDIELVGLCQNGLEAYDMILDESPDIVLTDIKMPGLDGLELIDKISQCSLHTQFIILSGFGEFNYAKRAMKYGVKHYLLKPCNENQIIESIQDIKKDCYEKRLIQNSEKNLFYATDSICHNAMISIINDIIYQHKNYDTVFQTYEPYLDFYFTPYRLIYIYYLEQDYLDGFLEQLKNYFKDAELTVTLHGIYTTNTLLLFFKDFSEGYDNLVSFLKGFQSEPDFSHLEIAEKSYQDLSGMLHIILDKVKRYSIICYVNNFRLLSTCNYTFISQEAEQLLLSAFSGKSKNITALLELLSSIQDITFLKQISSGLLLKITAKDASLSAFALTEALLVVHKENDLTTLKTFLSNYLLQFFNNEQSKSTFSAITRQIIQYVEEHIQDPNLTLKYIAQQNLFMNADYVSKKFQKDTGMKFSTHLTNVRISKAKEYLASDGSDKIQSVAELVGCGNNPQYFSQLFKKHVGMTPSTYAGEIKNG